VGFRRVPWSGRIGEKEVRGAAIVEFDQRVLSIVKLVANICSLMVCPINILNKILEILESRQLGFWVHRIL
jgi:hypothetical protein